MKVERGSTEFRHILIALQTMEEADVLWHLLNKGMVEDGWQRYISRYGLSMSVNQMLRVKEKMWADLNAVYQAM